MFIPTVKVPPMSEAAKKALAEYNAIQNEFTKLKGKLFNAEVGVFSNEKQGNKAKAAEYAKDAKRYKKELDKVEKRLNGTAYARALNSDRKVDDVLAEDARNKKSGARSSPSSSGERA